MSTRGRCAPWQISLVAATPRRVADPAVPTQPGIGPFHGPRVIPDAAGKRETADLLSGQAAHRELAVAAFKRASGCGQLRGVGRLNHRGPRGACELGHRAVGDQPPAADHHQMVCGVLHFRHQVAGDGHRAALGRQRPHQQPDPADSLWGKAVNRLVEHEDLRTSEQRRGDAQPLAHAEREPLGPLPHHVGQPDNAENLIHPPTWDRVGLRQAQQVAAGTAPAVHGRRVQQRANFAHRAEQPGERLAVDDDRAGRRPVKAEDHPHGRGLVGAVAHPVPLNQGKATTVPPGSPLIRQ
jgi:hypothetical protein